MAGIKHGSVNGHPVELVGNEWCWTDTGKTVKEDRRSHPCQHCGLLPGPDGEDGCLGHLPGVVTACCGQGKRPGYIIFENGQRIDFELTEQPKLATPTMPLQLGRTWIVAESGEEL